MTKGAEHVVLDKGPQRVPTEVRVILTPQFPKIWYAPVLKGGVVVDALFASEELALDWLQERHDTAGWEILEIDTKK